MVRFSINHLWLCRVFWALTCIHLADSHSLKFLLLLGEFDKSGNQHVEWQLIIYGQYENALCDYYVKCLQQFVNLICLQYIFYLSSQRIQMSVFTKGFSFPPAGLETNGKLSGWCANFWTVLIKAKIDLSFGFAHPWFIVNISTSKSVNTLIISCFATTYNSCWCRCCGLELRQLAA